MVKPSVSICNYWKFIRDFERGSWNIFTMLTLEPDFEIVECVIFQQRLQS